MFVDVRWTSDLHSIVACNSFFGLDFRWKSIGALYFFRSAISSRCIARMLLLATSGAQGLYSGTSQCGSHPGGLVFTPPAKAQRRRSLMDTLGQHAGTG